MNKLPNKLKFGIESTNKIPASGSFPSLPVVTLVEAQGNDNRIYKVV